MYSPRRRKAGKVAPAHSPAKRLELEKLARALAASDVRHRVDRLDPREERLLHRLALDDTRSLELELTPVLGLDRPTAVERIAERVDDTAE